MIAALKNYRGRLRQHPEQYWFKRKSYGWGWTPSRWQGWIAVAVFIVYAVWCVMALSEAIIPQSSDWLWYFVKLLIGTSGLIILAAITGEPPRWQWGKQKTDKPDQFR